jgi:hypothetical protein
MNGTGAVSSSSGSSSSSGINPASVGIKAFNALAGYIFGGNASGAKMAMTTPVFSSTDGTMEFVVSANAQQVRFKRQRLCVDAYFQLGCSTLRHFLLFHYKKTAQETTARKNCKED